MIKKKFISKYRWYEWWSANTSWYDFVKNQSWNKSDFHLWTFNFLEKVREIVILHILASIELWDCPRDVSISTQKYSWSNCHIVNAYQKLWIWVSISRFLSNLEGEVSPMPGSCQWFNLFRISRYKLQLDWGRLLAFWRYNQNLKFRDSLKPARSNSRQMSIKCLIKKRIKMF